MGDLPSWGPGTAGAVDFEILMRRRRFTRCVLQAEAAIEAGDLEKARVVLDEARELMPDAPEVIALEARMAEGCDPLKASAPFVKPDNDPRAEIVPPVPEDDLSDDSDEPAIVAPADVELVRSGPVLVELERNNRGRRSSPRAALAVVQLALMGVASYALIQVHLARTSQRETSAAAPPTDSRANGETNAGKSQQVEAKEAPKPDEKVPPPAKPAVLEATAASIPSASPVIRTDSGGRRKKAEDIQLRAAEAAATSTLPQPEPQPSSTREGPSYVPAPAITEPAVLPEPSTLVTPVRDPVETTAANVPPRPDTPPAAAVSPRTVARADDDSQIRALLARYESAYNRLDAKAASSVWPNVNSAELDRAFRGLVSQKISLGSCAIMKIGDKGLATCAGRAAWEPKVGGGNQTAQRYWAFDLQKNAEGWRIEQIRVR